MAELLPRYMKYHQSFILWFSRFSDVMKKMPLPYEGVSRAGDYVTGSSVHVLACSKAMNIYIIGSNGIRWAHQPPSGTEQGMSADLAHSSAYKGRWTWYSQSSFFLFLSRANAFLYELSYKIEQILKTAICWNWQPGETMRHRCFVWPWNYSNLCKAVSVWETPDYSPFLGQLIISVQVLNQWPTF